MKQIIHSKFKPMKKEPLFVALSNQKGGVGKSTFTVLLKATNKGSFFIGLNLECIICFISVRIFSFHHTAMHPLVYGNDALFAGLHEYIAYHIAPV